MHGYTEMLHMMGFCKSILLYKKKRVNHAGSLYYPAGCEMAQLSIIILKDVAMDMDKKIESETESVRQRRLPFWVLRSHKPRPIN